MRRIGVVLLLLIGLVSIGLWLKVHEEESAAAKAPGGTGVIEGVAIDISARISSRISAIHVAEGQKVEAGQKLVDLECSDPLAVLEAAHARLASAESGVVAAKAQAEAALGAAQAAQMAANASGAQKQAMRASQELSSRTAERVERLKASGNVTISEVDRAQSQLLQLTEQLNALDAQGAAAASQAHAARAQAAAARGQAEVASTAIAAASAEVKRAEALVAECTLTAPRAGVIDTRALEPGEAVLPGTRILRLVDLDPAETTFYLPNAELAAAAPGGTVSIVADAYPGKAFSGTVVQVASEAEFTPRNVQTKSDRDRLVYAVRVRIPNAGGELRAGMPVEVSLEGGR